MRIYFVRYSWRGESYQHSQHASKKSALVALAALSADRWYAWIDTEVRS